MKKTTLFFTFLIVVNLSLAQIAISTTTGAIPDANPVGTDFIGNASSPLNSITNTTLDLDINHTWNGDLIVTLTSPEGTSVTIIDRPGTTTGGVGCNENGMQITLDDASGTPIEDCTGLTSPYPAVVGTYSPNNPLSNFNGENPNGIWILNVSDNAGGDTGDLIATTINIMGQTLGIEENKIDDFNMYPNPVQHSLIIEAPKTIETITVNNILGQEIMHTFPNSLVTKLDMSNLQSGLYIVKATIDGAPASRRIVKE